MRFYLLFFFFFCQELAVGQTRDRIVIELNASDEYLPDSIELNYSSTIGIGKIPVNSMKHSKENKKWILFSDTVLYASIRSTGKFDMRWPMLVEPGDSVVVNFTNGVLSFSGRGAIKGNLLNAIYAKQNFEDKPKNPVFFLTESVADYLEWNSYLNNQCRMALSSVDSCKDSISQPVYKLIKGNVIADIEQKRHMKFHALYALYSDKKAILGLNSKDLCEIYDSTCLGDVAKWARSLNIKSIVDPTFISHQVSRQLGFPDNQTYSSLIKSNLEGYILMYNQGKKEYSDNALQEFLLNHLSKILKNIGFNLETEKLLAQYYSYDANENYKVYFIKYENEMRVLREGMVAPNFLLTDPYGRSIEKEGLRDKILLVNFLNNSDSCRESILSINKLKSYFMGDTNIVFLNVMFESDTPNKDFLNKIQKDIHFLTAREPEGGILLKRYNVTSFPTSYLINGQGRVVAGLSNGKEIDNSQLLIKIIESELATLRDGPYVFYSGKNGNVFEINGIDLKKTKLEKKRNSILHVYSDEYNRKFSVEIKRKLVREQCEFEEPERIFVLSDIEGDFDAFRSLLISNGVIDSDYDWTFGKGHVVFNGDFLDRGKQVTEVLWLIYSLEEKAKKAGGYVHYILGNHEIMNLNGDYRYVNQKYKDNAKKMGLDHPDFFNEDSELGRWLRTKNIMERIGSTLFAHAGISKELDQLGLSIASINEICRPFYSRDSLARNSGNKNLSTIFDYKLSPFWYRQYYMDVKQKVMIGHNRMDTLYKPDEDVIDTILYHYNVKHIVTGHTIINPGHHVTLHYGGKVINTDTRHAKGFSEGLLIQGDRLFRVGRSGDKVALISDEELTKND